MCKRPIKFTFKCVWCILFTIFSPTCFGRYTGHPFGTSSSKMELFPSGTSHRLHTAPTLWIKNSPHYCLSHHTVLAPTNFNNYPFLAHILYCLNIGIQNYIILNTMDSWWHSHGDTVNYDCIIIILYIMGICVIYNF